MESTDTMPQANYTYSDVDKSLSITNNGNVKVLYDVDVIIQSLKIIIATFTGEMVRSPIGSRIVQFIGRVMDDAVAEDIQDELVAMISEYEPRVEVLGIQVKPEYDEQKYSINVNLRIRSLGETINYNTRIPAL
tara:strand:+ start:3206 stop:3607 length:402 start_codon:yes stop_codon:yes gene_type:complete